MIYLIISVPLFLVGLIFNLLSVFFLKRNKYVWAITSFVFALTIYAIAKYFWLGWVIKNI